MCLEIQSAEQIIDWFEWFFLISFLQLAQLIEIVADPNASIQKLEKLVKIRW